MCFSELKSSCLFGIIPLIFILNSNVFAMTTCEGWLLKALTPEYKIKKSAMDAAKVRFKSAWRAAVMPAPDTQPETIARFYKEIPEIRASVDELLVLAKKNFDLSGVATEKVERMEHPVLRVLPGDGSLFNRYVRGAQRTDPTLQFLYDPLGNSGTASFSAIDNALMIGEDGVLSGTPRETNILHENDHKNFFSLAKNGNPSPYSTRASSIERTDGIFPALPGAFPFGGYSHFLFFEELSAHRFNLRDNVLKFILNPKLLDSANLSGDWMEYVAKSVAEVSRIVETAMSSANAANLVIDSSSIHKWQFIENNSLTSTTLSLKSDHFGKLYHVEILSDKSGFSLDIPYSEPSKKSLELKDITKDIIGKMELFKTAAIDSLEQIETIKSLVRRHYSAQSKSEKLEIEKALRKASQIRPLPGEFGYQHFDYKIIISSLK